jgi:hypothetical protein
MRRREFITLLGGAALASPVAARAQQPGRMRRVGVLMGVAESDALRFWEGSFLSSLEPERHPGIVRGDASKWVH